MGNSLPLSKPPRLARHPQRDRRHGLQQQAGVTGRRGPASKQTERDRLRQCQANVQSDAI